MAVTQSHRHETFLIVLLLTLQLPPDLAKPTSEETASETNLLLALKDSFTNGQERLPSWVNGTDVCAWQGVGCSASGLVDRVELLEVGLEGTIPQPDGWVLPPGMTRLALGNNRISGPIPPGWKLPATLTTLYLTGNQLSGTLNPAWSLGAGLESILLDKNNLSGPLPNWRLPPQLQCLRLDSNRLTGTIPSLFTTSKSMQIMGLANNSITGQLPARFSFDTSQELYGLFVWGNNLSGTLPTWPAASKALVDISPGNDNICGPVPSNPSYLHYDLASTQKTPIASLPACHGNELSPSSSASNHGGSTTVCIAVVAAVIGGALAGTAISALWCWKNRRSQANNLQPNAVRGKLNSDEDRVGGQDFVLECACSEVGTPELSECIWSSTSRPAASLPCSSGLLASDPLLASIMAKLSSPHSGLKTWSEPQSASSRSSRSKRSLGVEVKDCVIPFQELQLQSQIGQGPLSQVYLATWREVKVAAKLLLGPEMGNQSDVDAAASHMHSITEQLQQEASLISGLRHPNVLSFTGICTMPPVLVMEYCPRGSLYGILKSASASQAVARQLDWTVRLKMAMGVAQGMLYLHTREPPILHCDLKSPNLLISDSWTVKVAGFSLNKITGKPSSRALTNQLQSGVIFGDPRWLAPEVLAGQPHSIASDVFSFGLVLWGILTFQDPWEGTSDVRQICNATAKGSRPPLPEASEVPGPLELRSGAKFEGLQAYMQLIKDCWAQDPAERPAFGDIVSRLRSMTGRPTRKTRQTARTSSV